MITVTAKTNPLESSVVVCYVEPGSSLLEIVGVANDKLHITLNDEVVPINLWVDTYPADGDFVRITVVPGAFGIDIALALASVAASMPGAATVGAAAGTAAMSLGTSISTGILIGQVVSVAVGLGTMASMAMSIVSAVVRPQVPSSNFGTPTKNRFYSLTQGTNSSEPWGYIPKLYGELRITPPLAGQYYTVTRNGEQYLHVLLCLGYGPLAFPIEYGSIDSVKVGKSAGVPLITSVQEHARPYINNNMMIGDASIGALGGSWDNFEVSPVRWQIGTVDAILSPAAYVGTGEDAIYNIDVEEKTTDFKLATQAELWYTDNDNTWVTEKKNQLFPGQGSSQFSTSSGWISRVQVDINFPALYSMQGEMQVTRGGAAVLFQVEYRRENGTEWKAASLSNNIVGFNWAATETIPNPGIPNDQKATYWLVYGETTAPVRRANWFSPIWYNSADNTWRDGFGVVPAGTKYDVRVIRVKTLRIKHVVTTQSDCTSVRTAFYGIQPAWLPSDIVHNTGDVILAALQIKATNRVNGSLEPVSVIAQSMVREVVAGTLLGPFVASSNPADLYVDVLSGTHLHEASRLPVAQLDLPALLAWKNFCNIGHDPAVPRKYTYNYYHTDSEPMLDRMRAIATTGRAAWALKDGKVSVVRDNEFVPVQMITPRNSWGFEFTKNYPQVPHALRVRWVNPETWQQDELLVLDDGYRQLVGSTWYDSLNHPLTDLSGTVPPTLFEVLETQGVTAKEQAFREGRYFLAAMRLRRETFKVSMDIENIVATRGDCIRLTHDALVLARRSGRVLSVHADTRTLDLDEPVSFDWPNPNNLVFCLRVRSVNGGVVGGVSTYFVKLQHPGTDAPQYTVTALAAENSEPDPFLFAEPGDLFLFGRHTFEMVDAKVTQIDYNADLSANLTLVAAAPGVLNADKETINENIPGIVPDPPPELRAPPTPIFLSLEASPHDVYLGGDGKLHCKVVANWAVPQSGSRTDFVYAFYSVAGADWKVARTDATLGTVAISEIPVATLVTVFLQGFNAFTGRFSDPTEAKSITTPDANFFVPYTPSALRVLYEWYKPVAGPTTYRIRSQWRLNGFSANVEISWIEKDLLGANPTPGEGQWQGLELGAGAVGYLIETGFNGSEDSNDYLVAVRNKVLDDPNDNIDPWSTWAVAQVTVYKADLPPESPTDLDAIPLPNGIQVTWELPVGEDDYVATEVWHSRYNNRDGNYTGGYAVPPAALLATVDSDFKSWDHVTTDIGYHYYWIRGVDAVGQHSKWERAGSNEGVWAKPGAPGDGSPPPPVTDVKAVQDNWQVRLDWERPVITDLLHTTVRWRKSALATDIYTTDEQIIAGTDLLGLTLEKFITQDDIFIGDIKDEEPYVYYHYYIRNDDIERKHSEFVHKAVRMEWNADNYKELFKVKQLNAEHIDSKGLTIKDWPEPEGDGGIILGSGASSLPTWMKDDVALMDLVGPDGLGIKNYFRGAVIDKGLVLAAKAQADPAVVMSYDFMQGQETPEGEFLRGKGWRILGNGKAEFEEISARGNLKSNSYNPGKSGWALNESGDCEFNNGTFRGRLSADTLILGVDYRLWELSEQTLLKSINIRGPSAPWFRYNALGVCQSNAALQCNIVNAPDAAWQLHGVSGGAETLLATGTGEFFIIDEAKMKKTVTPTITFYDSLKVTATAGGYSDSITLHKLVPGEEVKLILSNETYQVAVDTNGTPISYKYGFGYATLFQGDTEIPWSDTVTLSHTDTGCTIRLYNHDEPIPEDPRPGYYEVIGVTAEAALAQITAHYNSNSYAKGFRLAKQKSVLVGARGSRFYVFTGGYSDATWSVPGAIDNLVIAEGGTVVDRDVVTLRNLGTGYSKTKARLSGSWSDIAAFVNGDMVVHGSIYAAHLSADSVTADKVKAGEIKARHIHAGEINSDHITTGTLTADRIVSGSLAKLFNLSSAAKINSLSGEHTLYIGAFTPPAVYAGGYCNIIVQVFFESAVVTSKVVLSLSGAISSDVDLYNKENSGQLDSRSFSGMYGWDSQYISGAAIGVTLKIKHAGVGTSSDPRALITLQRA